MTIAMTVSGLLAGGLVLVTASIAWAQGPAPFEFGYGHLNIGVQATSPSIDQDTRFPLYDETARIQTDGNAGGGVLLDLGGGVHVWRRLYAGLSYTFGSNTNDAALTATVPHPSIFDQPRTVTATTPDLKHTEHAVHLQAMWRMPITTKFDVSIGGGPTFFSVTQDLVSGITVQEIGNPTTGVNLTGITTERAKDSPVGYNIQADGTYLLNRRYGVGAFLRITGGSADLKVGGDTVGIDVGGFQLGIGGRVRF
jgi:hypothetical protein